MTKGIIAALWVIVMFTACARENDARSNDNPPEDFKPINTGREFQAEDFPNVANTLYGAWDADTADFGDGLAYLLSLYINENGEVGMKKTCVGGGDVVEAATVVDAKITSSKIKIDDSAYVLEKGGGIANCDLTVNAGSFSYKRSGNKLEVTFSAGQTRSFTRAK